MVKNLQAAKVNAWEDMYLIHAESRTKDGIWIATEPLSRLSSTSSLEDIGAAILEALKSSKWGVLTPTNWKNPPPTAAGFRSYKAFLNGVKCCSVETTSSALIFKPLRNGGHSGDDRGFSEIANAEICLPKQSEQSVIGQQAITALELSKCHYLTRQIEIMGRSD